MDQLDATLRTAALNDASRLSIVPPSGQRTPGMAYLTTPIDPLMVGRYAVVYLPDSGGRGVALAFNPTILSTMSRETWDAGIPADWRALAEDGGAQTAASADGTGQVRTVAAPAPGGILVVTSRLDDVNHTVDRLRQIVLIGSAAAVLLIGLGVSWALRRGFRAARWAGWATR